MANDVALEFIGEIIFGLFTSQTTSCEKCTQCKRKRYKRPTRNKPKEMSGLQLASVICASLIPVGVLASCLMNPDVVTAMRDMWSSAFVG